MNIITKIFIGATAGLLSMIAYDYYRENIKLKKEITTSNPVQLKDLESTESDKSKKSNTHSSTGNYKYFLNKETNSSPNNYGNPNNENNLSNLESYINNSNSNKEGSIDATIIIVDSNKKILPAISSEIANSYTLSGKFGKTGLIKSDFFQLPQFNELGEGNSQIIEKMKLNKYTDYLVIGELNSNTRKGTLADGTYVCELNLLVNIISVNDKSISRSFSLSANGNGANESQAKEYAKNNLVNKYTQDFLTL